MLRRTARSLPPIPLICLIVLGAWTCFEPADEIDLDTEIARLEQQLGQRELDEDLVAAACFGDVEMAREALENGADIDAKGAELFLMHSWGETPLERACAKGHMEMVRFLVERGAYTGFSGTDYVSPLWMAAEQNNAEVIEYLVGQGCDPYLELTTAHRLDRSFLLVLRGDYNSFNFLGEFYELGEPIPLGEYLFRELVMAPVPDNVMFDAALMGADGAVDALAAHGAYVGRPGSFMDAVIKGDAELVKRWLERRDFDLETLIWDWRWTPLHFAAALGRTEVVGELVAAGAEIDALTGRNLESPLSLAAERGRLETVKALVELGADVGWDGPFGPLLSKALSPDPFWYHPVFRQRRAITGREELLAYLIEAGADPAQNNSKALQDSARWNHPGAARMLIDAGAVVDDQGTALGQTALHSAARFGSDETAAVLLEAGADPEVLSKYDDLPVHRAAERGNRETLTLLADYGADLLAPDQYGSTSLHRAAERLRFSNVEFLLSRGIDPDLINEHGVTPLELAMYGSDDYKYDPAIDQVKTITALLKAGADPFRVDEEGVTLLHGASGFGSEAAVRLLLELGLDPNATDAEGLTPLHLACRCGNYSGARLLLDAGTDPLARDNEGKTPWELIEEPPSYPSGKLNVYRLEKLALEFEGED